MRAGSYGFFLILWICFSAVAKAHSGCSRSSIPKNQNIELPSNMKDIYANGEALRVNCQIGYAGFPRITCSNDVWTISGRGKCEPKQCGHPGDTPHGDFMLTKGDDFVFGSQVEYNCKKGYILAGKINHRSCLAQGWDNAIPICEVVKCRPIQPTGDVIVSGNTESPHYGDVIQFECQNDKKRDGEKQIHCTDTGEWSTNVPTCVEVTCKQPVIPNGLVTNEKTIYKKDDVLLFTCGESYKPVGRGSSICTQHDWMPEPQCEEKVCEVGRLTDISPKKSIFYPGERATVVCKPPYRTHTKKEQDTAICGNDGWSFNIDCEEIFCTVRPEDNAAQWYGGYSFKYGKTLSHFYCQRGFKKSAVSTCEAEGWVPPLCQAKICTPEIPNAIILSEIKNYTLGEQLVYECKPSHEPEGRQYSYCQENGWERKLDCKARKSYCQRPDLDYGYYINHKSNPSVIYYGCLSGYKTFMEGWWDELTCNQNEWSDTPKCIDETICVPPTILNAIQKVRKDMYSNGEFLTFECDDGYEMEGTGQIKCVNGSWVSPLPICKPSIHACNPPPRVAHAIITSKYKTKYVHLSKVQYQCRELYEIVGNREVTCISGTWSPIPTCIRSMCSSPKGKVNHAELVSKKEGPYENGRRVNYKCEDTTFIPEGETTAICINGIWQYPRCIRKDTCEKPVLKDGFVESKTTYNAGDMLEYQCYSPCKPKTNSSITCIDGQWNNQVECICSQPTTKTCQNPPIPENGDILHKEVEDGETVVSYKCNLFYKLEDDTKVKCHMGEWKPFPVCLRPCDIETIAQQINVKPLQNKYVVHGEERALQCKSQYYTDINWNRRVFVKCQDGEINYTKPCQHQNIFYS